MTNSTYFM